MFRRMALAFLIAPILGLPLTAHTSEKQQTAYARGDLSLQGQEWLQLAKKGNVAAQFNVGLMHHNGQGVPQDFDAARKWYLKAAEQGFARAQNNLGFMYETSQGVPRSYLEAAKWYRLAARQGSASAQYNLGLMYKLGRGVTQDHVQAMKYWRQAADQDYPNAQYQLGVTYANGQGVQRDDTQAIKWFQKAASQRHVQAEKSLRYMREKNQRSAAKGLQPTTSGGFRVQLASVKSQTSAAAEAERLGRLYQPVLGNLRLILVPAELEQHGVFYRIRTEPINDRASAKEICRRLTSHKQGCLVIGG